MRTTIFIKVLAQVLVAFLAQADELVAKGAVRAQDSMDDFVDTMMDKLFERTLKVTIPPGQSLKVSLSPRAGFAPLASPTRSMYTSERTRMAQSSLSHRTAVVAGAVKQGTSYEVKQPKPINVNFKKGADGGIYVSSVKRGADERIQVGDKLLAVSASFGGEVWPAKEYAQTMMALNTRVGLVYMKLESQGKGGRGFLGGKKDSGPVTEYVCLDCGWIYSETAKATSFKQLPDEFACPQCQSAKRRFARKNPETGKLETGFDLTTLGTTATVVGGLIGVGVLAYIGITVS